MVKPADLRAAFEMADAEGSGRIDVEKVESIERRFGLVAVVSKECGDTITYSEFQEALRRNGMLDAPDRDTMASANKLAADWPRLKMLLEQRHPTSSFFEACESKGIDPLDLKPRYVLAPPRNGICLPHTAHDVPPGSACHSPLPPTPRMVDRTKS